MKILFIEPYPTEGPSSRYRVEQYIPYLEKEGIDCILRPFISSGFYKIIYERGFYFKKGLFFIQSSAKRFLDLFTAIRCDIVFIHLEAFPLGPPVFEWLLAKAGKKIIYDLDDAIYMGKTSDANKFIKYLKWPSKVKTIIRASRHVIACNEYLAGYVRIFNENVTIIHTSVDTEKFAPGAKNADKNITIGWIGSYSTTPYLEMLEPVFSKLAKRHKFDIKIIGASRPVNIPGVNVINKEWRLSYEVDQFRSLDIGVYPLPEDNWTKAKTGFKTIQYMSVGIPCVVSAVGANVEIVKDGINGFVVRTEGEWLDRLSKLIEDRDLRIRIGTAGRKTVEEKFSLQGNVRIYLDIIKKVAGEK